MKMNLCFMLCVLCGLIACDLNTRAAGKESYKKPIPIESSAYEYGTIISTDDYVLPEAKDDYIQHTSKGDYDSSRAQIIEKKPVEEKAEGRSKKAEVEEIKEIEEKKTGAKTETDTTSAFLLLPSALKEPDDVLLVPERVAREKPKPEIIAPPVGVIVVEKGDTVYSLSKKHNVPLRDLLEENKISAPYAIGVGQKLRLPAARMHTVVAGDTLYSISRAYSVDINSLATENNLVAPFALAVGQKLRLPASVKAQESAPTAGSQQVAAEKELEKLNAEKKKIDAEKQKLEAEKKKAEEEKKKAEEAAKKAATEKQQQEAAKQKAEAEKKRIEADKKKAELEKKEKVAVQKIAEQKKKISSAPTAPLPKMDAAKPMRFTWPVRGRILSNFGYKSNGLYNDGINIGAPLGTAVKASESGVVAYAGNELKGMGNLVIIQHNGGWMTVYAHLDIMNVQRGRKVASGEKIGTIGKTGKVTEPQLHFEIRKGTKAYNPQRELK